MAQAAAGAGGLHGSGLTQSLVYGDGMAAIVCGDPMTVKEVNLEELIRRMSDLLDRARAARDPSIELSGMGDVLLAMEDRVRTMRYRTEFPNECGYPSIKQLLENA